MEINKILPFEVLVKILKYVGRKKSEDIIPATLVCKQWKMIIDQHHKFDKLKLFEKTRTEEELKCLLASKRSYKAISLEHSVKKPLDFDKLYEILEAKKQYIEGIHLKLGLYTTLNYDFFYSMIEKFASVNLKEFFVDIYYCTIESVGFKNDMPKILFPKLKNFKMTWLRIGINSESRPRDIFVPLLNIMIAPKLEHLNINFESMCNPPELEICWDFIHKNSDHLKSLNFAIRSVFYSFDWDPYSLYVESKGECVNEMSQFLNRKCGKIKELTINKLNDTNFISMIFHEAPKLIQLRTDRDITEMYQYQTFPNIKTLTLWKFEGNAEKIAILKQIFPNLKKLQIFCPVDFENYKIHVLNAFRGLEMYMLPQRGAMLQGIY